MLMSMGKATEHFLVPTWFSIFVREARNQSLTYEKFHTTNYCEPRKENRNSTIITQGIVPSSNKVGSK